MNLMEKFRLYHAILGILAVLAYLTGEAGIIHAWLGYGLAVVIVLRLLSALGSHPQLGLSRFYPNFDGLSAGNAWRHPAISKALLLGIAVSLILATVTGVMMDKGRAIGLADTQLITKAYADDDDDGGDRVRKREHKEEEPMEEVHEFFANLMLLLVGAHIGYLLAFKRPLATYMLYLSKPKR